MKNKIIEIVLGLSCAIAFVLACGERPDGSCDVWWTIGWLGAAGILGFIWGLLFNTRPAHVTQEAYAELQGQIEDAVEEVENGHKTIVAEAELPDDMNIYITVELEASATQCKFKDDAWGNVQTFTEHNWRCECEVVKVKVYDRKGNLIESDFDEDKLELEFETTEWR